MEDIVKIKGKKYFIYKWEKPEDADWGYCEVGLGIYRYSPMPIQIYCASENKQIFRPFGRDIPHDVQPLYVLRDPPVPGDMAGALIAVSDDSLAFKVGDAKDRVFKIENANYPTKNDAFLAYYATDAVLKKENTMKPIEKYQQKFIELLKEAEAELGDSLVIKVSSGPITKAGNGTAAYSDVPYRSVEEKEYFFSLSTNGRYI